MPDFLRNQKSLEFVRNQNSPENIPPFFGIGEGFSNGYTGQKREFDGNLLYVSGNSQLCVNLEGWDGVGDRREVQEGGSICIRMADSC